MKHIILSLLLLVACGKNDSGETLIERFDAYLEALNDHNVDKTISYLSDDFVLTLGDYGMTLSREQVIDILHWDAGVNARYTRGTLIHKDSTLTGVFTESNDFLELIGIPRLQARITYTLDQNGQIRGQLYYLLPKQRSVHEQMKPAVEWAKQNHPAELAEIYSNSQIIYTQETAKRWIRLLHDWQEATD